MERSSDASAMLGMDGFVVLAQTEEDGELYGLVETAAEIVGCPSCGVRAAGHDADGLLTTIAQMDAEQRGDANGGPQ